MNLIDKEALFTLIESVYLTADEMDLDFADFVDVFLKSNTAQRVFDNYESHYFNAYNIVIDLKESVKRKEEAYNRDFISYLAYIQVVFFLKTNLKVKVINSYINVEYIKYNFSLYHTLPDELVIESIIDDYNTRNNAMRKIRSIDNNITFIEGIDLYIAKWIVSTLYPYPNIDYLNYDYDEFPYLISDEYFFRSYIYKNIKELKKELEKTIYDKYCFKKEGIFAILLDESKIKDIDKITSLLRTQTCFNSYYLINNRYVIKFKKGSAKSFYYTIIKSEIDKIKLQYDLRYLDKCV